MTTWSLTVDQFDLVSFFEQCLSLYPPYRKWGVTTEMAVAVIEGGALYWPMTSDEAPPPAQLLENGTQIYIAFHTRANGDPVEFADGRVLSASELQSWVQGQADATPIKDVAEGVADYGFKIALSGKTLSIKLAVGRDDRCLEVKTDETPGQKMKQFVESFFKRTPGNGNRIGGQGGQA